MLLFLTEENKVRARSMSFGSLERKNGEMQSKVSFGRVYEVGYVFLLGWLLLLFFMTGDGAIVSWTEKAKWQGKIGFCMLMLDREFFDAKPIARLISERRCWFCCVCTEKNIKMKAKRTHDFFLQWLVLLLFHDRKIQMARWGCSC